jgi:hypothetical protein
VEDPAMILVVLFGLSSVQAFIAYLRQRPTENARKAPDTTPHPTQGEPPRKTKKAASYHYSS